MARQRALNAVVAIGVLSAAVLAARAEDSASAVRCSLDPGPSGTVSRIIDGETFEFADGTSVRLIGSLAPRAREASATPGTWPAENDAIKALSDLVLGKRVKLAFGGRKSDRYGLLLAHAFVGEGDLWVQGEMLDGGHGRVYGLPENFSCAAELLAHEVAARRRRAGLWDISVYGVKSARRPDRLMDVRGTYQRVIGRVASVAETKSATYINFGQDYKTDFTARVGKAVLAAHPDFGQRLSAFNGQTIVVRGWIERNNGPLIDVMDPSQIETVEASGETALKTPEPGDDKSSPNNDTATTPSAEAPADSGPKQVRPAPAEGPEPGGLNL